MMLLGMLWLFTPALSFGQGTFEFGVAPLSGPDGILVIIGGPPLHPSTATANSGWVGYHIYRKSAGDTGFVRITTLPISRPGSLIDLEKAMGGPIDGFERFAGLKTKQELWQSIEGNDSAIIAISFLSKNFRHALGLLITDTKVERGNRYEYRATVVDANGAESAPSESQAVTFGVPLIPMVGPLAVKGESAERGVLLTWRANPDDSGAFSYSIYRCPDSVGTFLKLNLAALTLDIDTGDNAGTGRFIDTTVQPGRTYYYTVVSADYAGNESPRKLVPVNLRDESRPAIPQNVFANPTELGITITWDTVAGATVIGYNLYRSADADSHYVKINTVPLPPDTGYYEDKTATLVDRFFYRVTAVNQEDKESEQSARALSLYENRREPLPPQNVAAVSRPNGIKVSWQPCIEPDVRGYYVYRADSYNSALSQVSPLIGKDTTEYLDTSNYLFAAGQYWYLVQSLNFTGMLSGYSVPAASYPDKTLAVDAPRSFFGYQDGRMARLFWSRTDDFAVAGYHVYRARETDSLTWEKLTATPLPRTAAEYVDTTATMESAWLYQLRAIDDRGTESLPSHDIRIALFEAAPLPPGGVRIAVEGNGLKVIWSKTLQTSALGYHVYRRSDTDTLVLLTAQPLPNGTTEFVDKSARAGVRYYFSVCCVDRSGREGDRSPEVSYLNK